MNFDKARFNMVEQQVRPWNVFDPRVLDLMQKLPREDFVPSEYRHLAYSDSSIPIDASLSDYLLPPREVGRMIQALKIKPEDTILEIGTGTGYVTAMLALLGQSVVTTEIEPEFQNIAKKHLESLKIDNVEFIDGNGLEVQTNHHPYDVICITGAVPETPQNLVKQLSLGGRLISVVGSPPAMKATLITRVTNEQFHDVALYETVIPYLKQVHLPSTFKF